MAVITTYVACLGAAWMAITHLTPDAISLHLFGRLVTLDHLHQRWLDKGLLAAVAVPAVFLVEFAWVGWSECSVRHLLTQRTVSSRSDLVCFLAGFMPGMTLVSGIMTLGLVLISGAWLRELIQAATGFSLTLAGVPMALQISILFFVYSLFDYWSHRVDHTGLFWPLHRFHHAADDFFVVTAGRTHPAVFTVVISATLPGALLGASADALIYLNLFIFILRLLIHSRIPSDFGWVGRYLVQSPLHHRLHHDLHRVGAATHLSLLPLWDHVFGTWDGEVDRPIRVGVEKPYRHGAWIVPDLLYDYRDFWSGVGALRSGALSAAFRAEGASPVSQVRTDMAKLD